MGMRVVSRRRMIFPEDTNSENVQKSKLGSFPCETNIRIQELGKRHAEAHVKLTNKAGGTRDGAEFAQVDSNVSLTEWFPR